MHTKVYVVGLLVTLNFRVKNNTGSGAQSYNSGNTASSFWPGCRVSHYCIPRYTLTDQSGNSYGLSDKSMSKPDDVVIVDQETQVVVSPDHGVCGFDSLPGRPRSALEHEQAIKSDGRRTRKRGLHSHNQPRLSPFVTSIRLRPATGVQFNNRIACCPADSASVDTE
jgi:hypothetical protein